MKKLHLTWIFDAEEMPALHRRVILSGQMYSTLIVGLVFLTGLVSWGLAPTLTSSFLLLWGLILCAQLALWGWRRTLQRVAWVELVLVAQNTLFACLVCCCFWALGLPTHYSTICIIWLAPMLGALVPLHPAVNSISHSLVCVCFVLGSWLSPAPLTSDPINFSFVIPVFAWMGWIAALSQRKQWWIIRKEERQVASTNKMIEMGRRAAAISHELNTPLAASHNALHEAQSLSVELGESIGHPEVGPEDLREILQELHVSLEGSRGNFQRIANFLQSLRIQSQQQHVRESEVRFPILPQMEGVLDMFARTGALHGLEVDLSEVPPDCWLRGDPGSFDQILMNLLENASIALQKQETRSLRIWVEVEEEGARLLVQDNGPGIPESLRERLFEAMVTTRASQGRTGLGLALCRDLAQGIFGGDLYLLDRPGGACFALHSPFLQVEDSI